MSTKKSRIEVICGAMFSGKTEELIRRVRRAAIAKQAVQVFKPEIDTRTENTIKSHDDKIFHAIPVKSSKDIPFLVKKDTTVVGIDEAQFFDNNLPNVVQRLADNGIRVIIAGLDMDFRGEPFGPMPTLLCCADEVQKLHAICMICGEEATRTQRIVNGNPAQYNDPIVMIGASETYEARCREHHDVPGNPAKVSIAKNG